MSAILIFAVTAILALVVGRYADRRGLVIASLVVLVGSAIVLADFYDGMSFVLFLVLNVALFEIVVVCMMLFAPAVGRDRRLRLRRMLS